jgi:CPA2 family monovalent cation:H+ antiporter-2
VTSPALEALLAQATILLGAAVVVLLASHRLRLPPIVGLLGTGALIGPSGLGLISDPIAVEVSAEIGVVFLLFTIGLELSLARLRELARVFWVGGSIQTFATLALAAGAALAAGLPWPAAVVLGFVAAPSSTAIVLKLYRERRELESPQGRTALGILLFQDVMLVPMLVALPLVAARGDRPLDQFLGLAAAAAIGTVVFAAARRLLPRLLERVARTRVREVFLFGALFACLGLSLATEKLGFSLALGAFVAGLLLAETDYRSQVVADVEPFRDLFASVFFVSIGMLVDVGAGLGRLPEIAAFVAALVAIKLVTAAVAVRVVGFTARIAALVACALAQIGEFSFVVAAAARAQGLIDAELHAVVIAAAALTLLATPGLVALAPRFADRLPGALTRRFDRRATLAELPVPKRREDHVVIVGFGAGGRTLARVLAEARIAYQVIEADAEIVARARLTDEPILFGDATRPEILRAAGLERARLAVLAISDPEATRRTLALARTLAPRVHLLVRTRLVAEIEKLRAAGADEVIAEEFESSIEIFTRVLETYHVPRNVVRAQIRVLRGEDYRMLRAPAAGGRVSAAVLDALAAGTTEVARVEPGSPAAGRTLAELDLRRATGALLIAVVRGEESRTNPPADFRFEVGDDLVLVGSHAEIDAAFALLEGETPGAVAAADASPPAPGEPAASG